METQYRGHRFPPEIISHAVWLYHRFPLSFRDIEDLLAERGILVSYEAIRYGCLKFAPVYARKLRKKQGRLGDIWHVDELFIRCCQVKQFGGILAAIRARYAIDSKSQIQRHSSAKRVDSA